MPTELRLHPISILFAFGGVIRQFALPAIVLLFSSRGGDRGWEFFGLLFVVPSVAFAVARYLTFRIRYEAGELVVRSGVLFRKERHIPYARIQNIEAVQNVAHRIFGVIEVRVQTGSGSEPEAQLKVVTVKVLDEMRQRVFAGSPRSAQPMIEADAGAAAPVAAGTTLLELKGRELLLASFLLARGMVVIGTVLGVAYELGAIDRVIDAIAGTETSRGEIRRTVMSAITSGSVATRVLLGVAAVVVVLGIVRALSTAWTAIRLYGFQLTRSGDDLGVQYGLLTKVVTSIPVRRIQTVTIRETPFHQLFRRASVRVETAGSEVEGADRFNQPWIAPVIRVSSLSALLSELVPDLDLSAVAWEPVDPRARWRLLRARLTIAILAALAIAASRSWWSAAAFALLVGWAILDARRTYSALGWSLTGDALMARRGWLWRTTTIARVSRTQVVEVKQTPLDRRHAMARLLVDTASGVTAAHRMHISYLSREVATGLQDVLTARVATT
jgi:putative membrane protein